MRRGQGDFPSFFGRAFIEAEWIGRSPAPCTREFPFLLGRAFIEAVGTHQLVTCTRLWISLPFGKGFH